MLAFKAAPGQFGPEVRNLGLLVWRVEKMKAVLLEPSLVGAFYNGDSYLVLQNRGQDGADLHMWIGEVLRRQRGSLSRVTGQRRGGRDGRRGTIKIRASEISRCSISLLSSSGAVLQRWCKSIYILYYIKVCILVLQNTLV